MAALKSIVYFIQAADGGPIKIGRSTEMGLTSRLSGIQTGNPRRLVICSYLEGTGALESELHLRFGWAHVRGEWFAPVPELVELAKARHEDPDGHVDAVTAFREGYMAAAAEADQCGRDAATVIRRQMVDIDLMLREVEGVPDASDHMAREDYIDFNAGRAWRAYQDSEQRP
jgi:hypothetical protein